MKKVTIYCGETIQEQCGQQLHPVMEVQKANEIIMSDKDEISYSNCSDFISAIKYIGIKQNVQTEFFLNGISCGDDIEPIFSDINRSLDLIDKLSE